METRLQGSLRCPHLALFPSPCGCATCGCATQIRNKLRQLVLSNDAVWARERAREEAGGGVETPWYVRAVYYALCIFLDVAYNNR